MREEIPKDRLSMGIKGSQTMRTHLCAGLVIASFALMGGEAKPRTEAVDFCALMKDPASFNGREVSTTASYRYGHEWQELFCISCLGEDKVWLEVEQAFQHRGVERALGRLPKYNGIINARFTGIFRGGGGFGDGGYRYQFELDRLEKVEVVSKSGVYPTLLPATERRRLAICGANPD